MSFFADFQVFSAFLRIKYSKYKLPRTIHISFRSPGRARFADANIYANVPYASPRFCPNVKNGVLPLFKFFEKNFWKKIFFLENLGQAAPDDAYFTLQSHSWAELQPFENFKNGPKKGRFSALVTSKPRHGQGWDLRQKLSAPKCPPMMVLSGNAIKKFWVRDTLVDWQWPALLREFAYWGSWNTPQGNFQDP